jgi:hypothetical protein
MDNEQFLKQSEEQVVSTQATIQRVKKMIERAQSAFRRFGFACGNDEAMFALPFIQKMADDIALIAKGERDYLEFMGFKEPKGGWPTLHLGIANSEEETAIDRLLAEAQAIPLKLRKEFFNEEAPHSSSTSKKSTANAISEVCTQMDALLAKKKASDSTRKILKNTPLSSVKKSDPMLIWESDTEFTPTAPSPQATDTIHPESPIPTLPKQEVHSMSTVPLEIQEMFPVHAPQAEEEPIALLEASSHRIHRSRLLQSLRFKIQENLILEKTENNDETIEKKSPLGDTIPNKQKLNSDTTPGNFKTQTQVVLPQSSPKSLPELLTASQEEPSAITSLAAGSPRRFSQTRLIQDGDKFKIQKNTQL